MEILQRVDALQGSGSQFKYEEAFQVEFDSKSPVHNIRGNILFIAHKSVIGTHTRVQHGKPALSVGMLRRHNAGQEPFAIKRSGTIRKPRKPGAQRVRSFCETLSLEKAPRNV